MSVSCLACENRRKEFQAALDWSFLSKFILNKSQGKKLATGNNSENDIDQSEKI